MPPSSPPSGGVASPVIASPSDNPHYSNTSSLAVAGTCQAGSTVTIAGAESRTTSCSPSGTFSFNASQGADGNYQYLLSQDVPGAGTSSAASFNWVRDTVAPALTVSSPASSPYDSSATSISIAGTCEAGLNVALSGSASATQACPQGSYSFPVSESTDGTYNFSVSQTDLAGNTTAVNVQWVRNTTAPAAPVITSPASSPVYTNTSSIPISGSCETGDTVNLSGAATGSTTCTGGGFSLTANESTDGVYNLSITQTNSFGTTSSAATLQWVRDTAAPAAPTITNPASSPYWSGGSSLTISGGCETGATVNLAGSAGGSATCAGSAYSFTVSESVDGTYSFTVSETDLAGNVSGSVGLQWNRVTSIPPAPTIATPALNPYSSNGSSLTISGGCITGDILSLGGDATGTTTCVSSIYSFTVNESTDGTYNFNIVQNNHVSNSAAANLQWIRDTAAPAAPTISSPASSPYYSNGSSTTISGGCEAGATVTLAGSATASASCASSAYSFTVSETTDGNYGFTLSQTDQAGNASPAASFQWVRDTIAPAAPTVTNPPINPYTSNDTTLTISGGCESGATVTLSGATSANATCSNSVYSLTTTESTDGTYNYSLIQTDPAGNTSPTTTFQWTRSTTIPPTPTITSPASNPYDSNTSSLTISGGCITGYLVNLGGAATGQTTCASSAYSFTVNASADGTYSYTVTQQSNSTTSPSAQAGAQWIRDTVPPDVSITAQPQNPNIATGAGFSFSSTDSTAVFQCSLDSGAWTSCTSPTSFSGLTNASHTFTVRSVDPAGNISTTPASVTWQQENYNTIALYHFTNGSATVDSGLYTGPENNALTDSGATTSVGGEFGDGELFSAASSQYMYSPNKPSQGLGASAMTVETFVKVNSLPSVGSDMVIASRNGVAGNMGWQFTLHQKGSGPTLAFGASLNGTTLTTVRSSAVSLGVGSYHHVAVTWNKGSVTFFFDGTMSGTGTVGTVGSAVIFGTTADLSLGKTQTMGGSVLYFDGTMDEFRWSDIVRWTSNFTPPSAAYVGD